MIDRSRIREHMDVIDFGRRARRHGRRGRGRAHQADQGFVERRPASSCRPVRRRAGRRACPSVEDRAPRSGLALRRRRGAAAAQRKPANPLPPIRNPASTAPTPRRNYMLPWVLAGLALLALILALSQCDRDEDDRAVRTDRQRDPRGRHAARRRRAAASRARWPMTSTASWAARTACRAPSPSTRVNFDSGTANLRAADNGDLNDIARVLGRLSRRRARRSSAMPMRRATAPSTATSAPTAPRR